MNRVNHTCCSLKRVTVRKALSALFREEPCEQFAFDLGESLSKTSDLLNKIQIFCIFCPRVNCSCRSLLFHSFLKSNGSKLLWSLFTNEWWERVIPVTLYKRATVRVISGAFSLTKNEWFAWKTKEQIPNTGADKLCVELDSAQVNTALSQQTKFSKIQKWQTLHLVVLCAG